LFLIGEPSAASISLLIDEQRGAPLSYAEVGASRDTPGKVSGYAVDHNRVRLGDGEEAFARAAEALYAWKMFDLGWVRLLPRGASARVGTTVAVLARHIGFRSLNFSRVVYEVSGEEGGVRKLGFAYGTLPEHAESGEERFVVERHPDGSVFYDLYAFSRPNHLLSRLGYPFARGLQRRFARGSLAAMARAVEG
jgi:uncharacterized protein (UPF0548 family)